LAKGGMLRHLATCPARRRVTAASDIQLGNKESLYHLRVQDAWQDDFWLDLEVRGSAALQELDDYLRAIWLECCGHLSQFSFGGWGGREISKRRRVGQVLEPGVELTHIYDFGTSSETLLSYCITRGQTEHRVSHCANGAQQPPRSQLYRVRSPGLKVLRGVPV
jgi:hypothetical protein